MTKARVLSIVCLFALSLSFNTAAGVGNFAAHLQGRNEVPPVITQGQGQAKFQLVGDELRYTLIVSNIENVTAAHIHLAPAGSNGAVVAWLFGFVEGGVTVNGILAQGTITGADLAGSLSGQPLSALIDAIEAGDTYVNVHTVANPPGEIRGQIR